jgi:hypothetical protein
MEFYPSAGIQSFLKYSNVPELLILKGVQFARIIKENHPHGYVHESLLFSEEAG